MKNTGTWDSDLVLLFLFMFLLPFFVGMLAKLIRDLSPVVSPDVVGLDSSIDETSIEVLQTELESVKKELEKSKSKRRDEKKKKKKKTTIDSKEKEMMQEAATALNKLGIKKSKANSIIQDLCKEKTYTSSEDLLQDAIVYI
ncbi:TPA: hypothetical protein HA278_07390 [Candidatus Woesearchaeota archaeon]|nr:hypothetical protein [Candidatus Woesearchaeota archaeon]